VKPTLLALRVAGPATAAAMGLALSLAGACTGDDTPPKFFDAAADQTTDVQADAPPDAPAEAGSAHGKIIVVNASPDLGGVRFCFGTGLQNDGSDAQIAPIAPLPAATLQPGAGAVLSDLGDLSHRAVTPYAVLAGKIGQSTCDALLPSDGGGLVAGADYFPLPTVKNGTFAASTTHLYALTGCLPLALDSAADVTTCGAAYDSSNGNLSGVIFSLDRVIGNTQRFGAQIAHVASPASGVWSSLYGASAVSAELRPFDAGATEVITDSVGLGAIAPTSAASLAMPTVDTTSLVVAAVNPDGGAAPIETSIPLPLVYEATTGQATGENAYFAPGVNYTFVFVGDPRAPATLDGGAFNGYSLHALAFPNDPPVP
jgi:hypothetical protein